MKAIVLAGGKGTRLRSVISDVPKPMAPINEKPFLEYILLLLKNQGVTEIVLSVCHQKEVISQYFSDGSRWGLNITYSEELTPLGTGGAIKQASEMVDEENFLVLNGDSIMDIDLRELINFHNSLNSLGTMVLCKMANSSRYGKVAIDSQKRIIAFREKSSSDNRENVWVNSGIYVFSKKMIPYIPDGSSSLEIEIFPHILQLGLYGFTTDRSFFDIGTPDDYQSFCIRFSGINSSNGK